MTREQAAEKLEETAREMRDKTYTASVGMVLLTRSEGYGGIMTVHRWGEGCNELIEEAFEAIV